MDPRRQSANLSHHSGNFMENQIGDFSVMSEWQPASSNKTLLQSCDKSPWMLQANCTDSEFVPLYDEGFMRIPPENSKRFHAPASSKDSVFLQQSSNCPSTLPSRIETEIMPDGTEFFGNDSVMLPCYDNSQREIPQYNSSVKFQSNYKDSTDMFSSAHPMPYLPPPPKPPLPRPPVHPPPQPHQPPRPMSAPFFPPHIPQSRASVSLLPLHSPPPLPPPPHSVLLPPPPLPMCLRPSSQSLAPPLINYSAMTLSCEASAVKTSLDPQMPQSGFSQSSPTVLHKSYPPPFPLCSSDVSVKLPTTGGESALKPSAAGKCSERTQSVWPPLPLTPPPPPPPLPPHLLLSTGMLHDSVTVPHNKCQDELEDQGNVLFTNGQEDNDTDVKHVQVCRTRSSISNHPSAQPVSLVSYKMSCKLSGKKAFLNRWQSSVESSVPVPDHLQKIRQHVLSPCKDLPGQCDDMETTQIWQSGKRDEEVANMKSSIANEKPLSDSEISLIVNEKPLIANKNPLTDREKSLTTNEGSLIANKRDLIANERPFIANLPLPVNKRTFFTNEIPLLAKERHLIANEKFSTANERSFITNERPFNANERPLIANKTPVITNERTIIVKERPMIASEKSMIAKEGLAIGSKKPVLAIERPTIAYVRPIIEIEGPTTAHEKSNITKELGIPNDIHVIAREVGCLGSKKEGIDASKTFIAQTQKKRKRVSISLETEAIPCDNQTVLSPSASGQMNIASETLDKQDRAVVSDSQKKLEALLSKRTPASLKGYQKGEIVKPLNPKNNKSVDIRRKANLLKDRLGKGRTKTTKNVDSVVLATGAEKSSVDGEPAHDLSVMDTAIEISSKGKPQNTITDTIVKLKNRLADKIKNVQTLQSTVSGEQDSGTKENESRAPENGNEDRTDPVPFKKRKLEKRSFIDSLCSAEVLNSCDSIEPHVDAQCPLNIKEEKDENFIYCVRIKTEPNQSKHSEDMVSDEAEKEQHSCDEEGRFSPRISSVYSLKSMMPIKTESSSSADQPSSDPCKGQEMGDNCQQPYTNMIPVSGFKTEESVEHPLLDVRED